MTAQLLRLVHSGRRLVTPELGRGEVQRYAEEAYRGYVEPMARDIELASLDDAVDTLLAATRPFEPAEIDATAAVAIHRCLPLTRREAADPAIWRFMAVVHRPDFIRHRWVFKSWATMKTRFWAPGTRPDSNTFSRLWWVAELTRSGEDYDLTRRVLSTQSLANAIFIRSMSNYRSAVSAAVDVLAGAPSSVVEDILLRLHRHLGVVPLEGLREEEIAALLRGWAERPRSNPRNSKGAT